MTAPAMPTGQTREPTRVHNGLPGRLPLDPTSREKTARRRHQARRTVAREAIKNGVR